MALTTDAIESAKSLLNAGAEKFKNYPGDLSRVPAFNVMLGGKALIMLDEKILSLELTDNRGFNADELTITVDDSQGDIELPPRGAELSVAIGWQGEKLVHKGIFIVDEIAHSGPPDRIEITARSADFRDEFNVKREVSWHDVTVERIVSAIAHRYKLKPLISEQLMSAEIDHADQTQESDMSFLTRMAEMLGAIATVKNGYLLFILPGVVLAQTAERCRSFPSRAAAEIAILSGLQIATHTLACRRTGLIWNSGKRKRLLLKSGRKPQTKSRVAAAGKGTILPVKMVTFLYSVRRTAVRWPHNVQQLQNGNNSSAELLSSLSPWLTGARIFIRRCTER
ncbi:Phage protein D [Yokenella regensburgei]|nr:Phage protein D [Yokenella regensburgei]